MHFQLRKAVVVTTIQLKSTRVRMFQTDNFIFQSMYVFKGSCGKSSVYFQRNTFLAIFKECFVFKGSCGESSVYFQRNTFLAIFKEWVSKKIAVWFEWSFSTELVLAIFREWVSTKNSSVVPVVVFYGTLLLAIFKDWVSKKIISAVPVFMFYVTLYWQFSKRLHIPGN